MSLLHWSYKRYLEKELRREFGFDGTAIYLDFVEKHVDRKKTEGLDWKKGLRESQLPDNKKKYAR